MIDFRYHLVSIVSIFLALAVGIVLGAGPLKGDIGTRLTEQVTALRADKAQLRTDLDASERAVSARDTFASAVAPEVLAGRLAGKTVALVVAPGADADLVKDAKTSLVAAGAKVGSTVTLTDSWADPTKATLRNTVASPFLALFKLPAENSDPDKSAAKVLARAILVGSDRSATRPSASASTALAGLKAGELISATPDQIAPSSSVVFLGGPVAGATRPDTEAQLAAYVQLIRLLDAGGSGVVVAAKSDTTDKNQSADLVAAVRAEAAAAKGVSTVDDADLPMGQGTLVLALEEQYAGGVGQYGLAGDAKAVVSDLPAK